MTAYRKRFIILTMLLVSGVMTIVCILQGIALYRGRIVDLRITLEEVTKPVGRRERHDAPPEADSERPDLPPGIGETPDEENKEEHHNGGIATAFVDKENGEISVLTEGEEEPVRALIPGILAQPEAFGRIGEYFYFYSEARDDYKIAVADKDYFYKPFAIKLAIVIGIYLVAHGALFCVSIWLSKYAAKPMEEAMEREKRFTTNISHDLKTPLTVIKMNNTLIARSPRVAGTELVQWTESTEEAVKRMQQMIEQMMELNELDHNYAIVVEDGVDLSQIVRELVKAMEPVAANRHVSLLSTEIQVGVLVRANSDYTSRIVAVLLDNAVKYEPEGGEVTVSLHSETKGGAELMVCNRDSRIRPEDMQHIFDRFWRGEKSRTSSGHGLGLPIAKKTAELMGAEITARSGEGGTVFTVVFPC